MRLTPRPCILWTHRCGSGLPGDAQMVLHATHSIHTPTTRHQRGRRKTCRTDLVPRGLANTTCLPGSWEVCRRGDNFCVCPCVQSHPTTSADTGTGTPNNDTKSKSQTSIGERLGDRMQTAQFCRLHNLEHIILEGSVPLCGLRIGLWAHPPFQTNAGASAYQNRTGAANKVQGRLFSFSDIIKAQHPSYSPGWLRRFNRVHI
ncbi:hypothetical protein IAQ61_007025 [Plenodomus lingam]|uniref:uncharacterized protein n=1 Tax=Leptosphaeria maculans TaxID=5022 RepID=UPI0033207BDA|nr:hypothetical protein IAQ61_007025 [Plenodomus lingam]